MPLPKPTKDDSQKVFIKRCMDDDAANKEFSDRSQRAGYCYNTWRASQGKSLLRTLTKGTMYQTIFEAKELVVGGDPDDAGWLEGYAAVYNNVDHHREVFRPGVFAQSIAERVPKGKVKLMVVHYAHGGGVSDLVGLVTEAKEVPKVPGTKFPGLWMHAEFSSVQPAQDVRTKAAEGMVEHLSVGYRPIDFGYIPWEEDKENEPVLEIKQAVWYETTLTTIPVNELTSIAAAKSLLADVAALPEGSEERVQLLAAQGSRLQEALAEVTELTKAIEELLATVGRPKAAEARLLAHQRRLQQQHRWLVLQQKQLEAGSLL